MERCKKRFGKEIDEQKLYEVFKFLIIMFLFNSFLELAKQKLSLSYLINNNIKWLYINYKGIIHRKDRELDENKFKEIVKRCTNLLVKSFMKNLNSI